MVGERLSLLLGEVVDTAFGDEMRDDDFYGKSGQRTKFWSL